MHAILTVGWRENRSSTKDTKRLKKIPNWLIKTGLSGLYVARGVSASSSIPLLQASPQTNKIALPPNQVPGL
jgi:hypothetical protein